MSKLAHSNDVTIAIIASQNCPDCCGRRVINLVGEEYPCPTCRPDDYEDAARERGLITDLELAGSGGLR